MRDALHTEDVLLKIRLRQGLPLDLLDEAERERAATRGRGRLAGAPRATGWCSPTGDGCWPTAVVRTLLG